MKKKDGMNEEKKKKQKPNNRQSFIPKPSLNDTDRNIEENSPDIFDTFVNDLHKGTTMVHTAPSDEELEEAMFNAFTDDLAIAHLNPVQKQKSGRPGRPVGTTIMKKSMATTAYKDMVDEITRRYANPNRDKSDTLKKIILTCQLEFDLLNSNVSAGTIKSRIFRGVLTARHPGTPSPMKRVEAVLVQLVKACSRNGRNIGQMEVMDLAVEWITDRKLGEELVDWKLIHCSTVRDEFR